MKSTRAHLDIIYYKSPIEIVVQLNKKNNYLDSYTDWTASSFCDADTIALMEVCESSSWYQKVNRIWDLLYNGMPEHDVSNCQL